MTPRPDVEQNSSLPEIDIWTDGACDMKQNGGWAFIVNVAGNPFFYHEESGAVPDSSSNQMELVALIKALLYIKLRGIEWTIRIHTDSSYLKNCFTQKWFVKWQQNGWKNSKNEPVANQDLWEMLIELMEIVNARWVKVKGHRGVELNERCDVLAVAARKTLLAA